jgi:hypothetical protein
LLILQARGQANGKFQKDAVIDGIEEAGGADRGNENDQTTGVNPDDTRQAT